MARVDTNRSRGCGQHDGVSVGDDQIVAQSVGDPNRFGVIFDRYFVTIHGYLSRRLGRSRADDLAGEVFRVAFEARARYDSARGEVRPWLYGIANNVLRRHLRDGERAERAWARVTLHMDHTTDERLEDQLDAQLLAVRLQQSLDRLMPVDREALMLFAVEQLTYAEIGVVMATPIGTVRSRISRARSHLRDQLDGCALVVTSPAEEPRHG